MDADAEHLYRIFRCSYSPVDTERREAESWLEEARGRAGLLPVLLRLALAAAAEAPVRQAAAVQMKNEVARRWAAAGSSSAPLAAEKVGFRGELLRALPTAHEDASVLAQLLECFRTMASRDFPDDWPGLLDELVAGLRSDDTVQTRCALQLLQILFKQQEARPASRRADADVLGARALPSMLALAPALVAVASQGSGHRREALHMLKLVLRCFYSSIYMAVGPYVQTDIAAWMEVILAVVALPAGLSPSSAHDQAAREAEPCSKCRKWAFRALYRFCHRHGSARRCVNGAEAFAKAWAERYEVRVAEVCLQESCASGRGKWQPKRSQSLALLWLANAASRDACYAHLKPSLRQLLELAIFPAVRFGSRDMLLWQEDPEEIVREIFNDVDASTEPRAAALELVERLVRHRGKDITRPLTEFCQQLLEMQRQSPEDSENSAAADGALLVLGAMSDELIDLDPAQASVSRNSGKHCHKAKAQGSCVEHLLARYARPLLASPVSFLRLRACWLVGRLVGKARRLGPQGTATALCTECLQLLADPELPVRAVAASCLHAFVLRENDAEARTVVGQNLAALLERLLRVLAEMPCEDVAEALEVLVDSFPSEIVPFAAQLVAQLAGQICQIAAAETADGEAGADNAALGPASTIVSVLRACASLRDASDIAEQQRRGALFLSLAESLLPLILRLLQPDGVDFIEEGLEMLAYLTAFCPSPIPQPIWTPFSRLYLSICGGAGAGGEEAWARDFMSGQLPSLLNYVSRGPPGVFLSGRCELVGTGYPEMIFDMVRVVLHAPGLGAEKEAASAAKLVTGIFQWCESPAVDAWQPRYLEELLRRLPTAETSGLRWALLLGLAAMVCYNAERLLASAVASGSVTQLFDFWLRQAGGPVRRLERARLLLLAELRLLQLGCAQAVPDAVSRGLPHVVRLLVSHSRDVLRLRAERAVRAQAGESDEEDEDGSESDAENEGGFEGSRPPIPHGRLDELALLAQTLRQAPQAAQEQVDAWLQGHLASWLAELPGGG